MDLLSATYWVPFCWGLVVLASWVGWGEVVRQLVGIDRGRVGWALRAGWGISAVLGMAGFLQAARLCDARVLGVMVLIGAVVAGLMLWEKLRMPRRVGMREGGWQAYLPVGILLLYLYATSVVAFDLNWWDDLPNYLVYVQKILHTGTLIEPYSLRRIVTYGGQQTLDAMVMIGGTFLNVDILEMGLGRLMFVGLLLEMVRPAGKIGRIFAAVALIVFVLVPRTPLTSLNTQSEMTGVVLFLTLLRTLSMGRERANYWRHAGVAGLVAAAVCTMRVNFLAPAVLSILLFNGMRALRERRSWKKFAARAAVAGVSFGGVLLPWAWVLYRSSGTFLYPMWAGNMRPEYAYFDAGMTLVGKLRWVAGFVGYPAGFALMIPLGLALYRRFRRVELPMAIAAVVSVVMTLLAFTLTEYTNFYRFVFPMVFGLTSVMTLRLVIRPHSKWQRVTGLAALALTAGMNLGPGIGWAFGERGKVWTMESASPLLGVLQNERAYRAAQGAAPAGAGIFSATSFPVLFDFSRNPIVIADVPGAVSPAPGMPIFEGAGAVEEYLKGRGIGYVVFTFPDVDRTLYSRAYWEPIFTGARAAAPDEVRCSKYNVAFIHCMEGLPGVGEVVFRSRTLCVVKLK